MDTIRKAAGAGAMSPRERVICALSGGQPDVVPFAEQTVGSRVARELLGIPDGEPYTWSALAEAIGNDVVVFRHVPPLYHEGADTSDGRSWVGAGLIRTRDDLSRLVLPEDETWIDDAKEFLRTQRGDRAAAGGTRLGISSTLISMGIEGFSMALYDDPGLVEEVLDRYVGFSKRTVEVFCELGFDLVWCFDDLAYKGGPMFSPEVLRSVFLPRIQRAAELITVPWIFHSDGDLFPVMDDLLSLRMSAIHPIEPGSMDLSEAKRLLRGRACVVGNISVDLLARGRPGEVRAAVEEAMSAGAPGGGYMISSGNSIPDYARIENVRAMLDAIAELRTREY